MGERAVTAAAAVLVVAAVVMGLLAIGQYRIAHSHPTVTATSTTVSSAAGSSGSSSLAAVLSNMTTTTDSTADVTITKCGLADNEFEGPQATLDVVNHSSQTSNYIITVAFDSPDGSQQLDTGDANVQALDPGQSTQVTAVSVNSRLRSSGQFTCKVSQVDRIPS